MCFHALNHEGDTKSSLKPKMPLLKQMRKSKHNLAGLMSSKWDSQPLIAFEWRVYFLKELWCHVSEKVKWENLVPNRLILSMFIKICHDEGSFSQLLVPTHNQTFSQEMTVGIERCIHICEILIFFQWNFLAKAATPEKCFALLLLDLCYKSFTFQCVPESMISYHSSRIVAKEMHAGWKVRWASMKTVLFF